MNNIKLFNTARDQHNFLEYAADYKLPHLSYNLETKELKHTKDVTNGLVFKYVLNGDEKNEYLNYNFGCENEYTITPKDIDAINSYDKETGELINVYPINSQLTEDPLYTVGLLSDIHYNDTDEDNTPDTYTDDGAEYSDDLKNALQYFYDNNVDFISCSGDITTDYRRHFRNYKLCLDTYGNGQAIYTCVGNHDTKPKDRAKEEWKGIDSINANYDIHRVDDKDGTSFYFVKELDNDKKDVYIYLNLSYGYYDELDENATEEDYSNTSYNTHYPRLLNEDELLVKTPEEIEWDDFHLYSPDTLRWFADVLEEYKDDRCFIFTHLMFNGKAGSYHGSEGYYDYFSNHADVIRGDQGMFLEDLLNKYDNNYWFSGHSHYKWLWEKYDHTINVTKSNNSWNIHIPSLSRPLPIEIYGYQNAPQDAEGAIMEVYNDYVVIKGIVFKNSSLDGGQIGIDTYNDSDMEYVTAEMFTIQENSLTSIYDAENNIVHIDTTYDGKDVYLNNGTVTSANFDNLLPVLRFEYIHITDDEGNIITRNILNECKIGFRDNTTDPNQWPYYFEDNHIYTNYPQGVLFKVSSASEYKNMNIHIDIRFKIGFKYEGYINKFLPIAIYKL